MSRAGKERPGADGSGAVRYPIPGERTQRDAVLAAVRAYVRGADLTAPLTLGRLAAETRVMAGAAGIDLRYEKWMMVLLNNETWREGLAAIPADRRLLLLPQCLRDAAQCPASFDEWGLVCRDCGRCALLRLRRLARELGYLVLISEGTAAVLSLVRSGRIDAFVGASCMATLEKVFPAMALVGLPAIALPLLGDGCRDTALDVDWLEEAMRLFPSGTTASLPAKMLCQRHAGGLGGVSSQMKEPNSPAKPTIEPLGSGSAGL